ncbi:adenosine kinase [Azospirillum halopraeferens]|uniref:adenosine kinase n=1 Tax=Azospirillum halopraeferens TaxID=34010 RepID=UPI000409C735|nr:adenosine kinase [Azospirillum halopraeferens]
MAAASYDVTGIGNAIVDVIAHADDAFLAANGIEKGAMTLIDAARAEELYGRMGPGIEVSGGSAGNTMAGFASLGGAGAYIGKVCNDQLGAVFRHDIRAAGVHFATDPLHGGAPTARCLILVTPDAQRSMNTYLGACVELGPEDIDEDLIAASRVTYMEGYLWDPPRAKEAFRKAAAIAHGAGRAVSLSLSDSFCVHRHHAEFRDLVENHVDVLFANEHEIGALYGTDRFEDSLEAVRRLGKVAALTRSEKGAVVVAGGTVVEVAAEPVERVVDTTGAGDLYAAGFLYGYTRGLAPAVCGRLGAVAAAEIIAHVGARPDVSLAELVRARGVL